MLSENLVNYMLFCVSIMISIWHKKWWFSNYPELCCSNHMNACDSFQSYVGSSDIIHIWHNHVSPMLFTFGSRDPLTQYRCLVDTTIMSLLDFVLKLKW